MVPQELIRQLDMFLDGAGVAADVRDMMIKLIIGLTVFWIVLLGLGGWIMFLKRK